MPPVASSFPPVLRAIVRALGIVRAREWLHEHGGVNVVIPRYRTTVLGLDSDEITRLRRELAPHMDAAGRIWLPKCDKLLRLARDAQMRRERNTVSIAVLARRYGISSRQVLNICRDDDDGDESPNLPLF
ncbi:MAG: hypothetical protein LBF91_01390 [Azoarcus sp.]|nr:hypothetical protein [Azoarcus sp.]